MARRRFRISSVQPLLDVASFARRGPDRRDQISRSELEQVELTVRRAPEVVVKVLGRGRHDLAGARAHLRYLVCGGELDLQTDEGDRVGGEWGPDDILDRWDLDLEADRPEPDLKAHTRRQPPKLFHKVTLSMAAGTAPEKVLAAARNFAREEFALKHRYALVLHTDEPHPHVHLVIKSLGEDGERLRIDKARLRDWRRGFARQLRAVGVPANATERAVRGKRQSAKLDGIYRSAQRRDSRHLEAKVGGVWRDLRAGQFRSEEGRRLLVDTRKQVVEGWKAVGELLAASGHRELADGVRRFVSEMPPVRTDRELIAESLIRREKARPREAPTR